jgi:hypothetical protein
LVAVLPQFHSEDGRLQNTLDFFSELYSDMLGHDKTTYMIYDNETTSDLSPTKSLDVVNEAIVEDIRILTGIDNFPTKYESIDKADFEVLLTTPGRLLITRLKKGLTEKVLEDTTVDELLVKAIKKSCHAETDRNKKVLKWGIITYFTEAVDKLYTAQMEKLLDFIGTPIERFNHNVVHHGKEDQNFLYFIASGLSPINDIGKKYKERIEELKVIKENVDAKKET